MPTVNSLVLVGYAKSAGSDKLRATLFGGGLCEKINLNSRGCRADTTNRVRVFLRRCGMVFRCHGPFKGQVMLSG